MATKAAKGRTAPRTKQPVTNPRRTKLVVWISGALAIVLVVALVLAFTLSGSSPSAAPTRSQVRRATQTNLTETTKIMATYSKARSSCADVGCITKAAQSAQSQLSTSWNTFNTAATGFKPLASSIATYAVDYANLLDALSTIGSATTLAQIELIESGTFATAQSAWLAEASSLFGELGGDVTGSGASTPTTTAAVTPTT